MSLRAVQEADDWICKPLSLPDNMCWTVTALVKKMKSRKACHLCHWVILPQSSVLQPNFKLPGQKHVFTQSCITDRSRLHVVYFVCLCACHDDILDYTVVAPCNLSYLSVSWLVGMFAKSCLWRCCEASSTISYPRCPIIFHHKCVNLCVFLHVLGWFHITVLVGAGARRRSEQTCSVFERDVSAYCD